jgi:hypothetical protein
LKQNILAAGRCNREHSSHGRQEPERGGDEGPIISFRGMPPVTCNEALSPEVFTISPNMPPPGEQVFNM